MKRTTHILSLTSMVLGAILITSLISSNADANKRRVIEMGDIAFVDVFHLVDLALSTPEMSEERDLFNTEAAQEIGAIEQQIQGLQMQMQAMQADDPNAQAAYTQFQQLQYSLQDKSTEINNRYQTLIAQQISVAYGAIYKGANEIGAQEGYAFVFSTRSDGELVQTESITGITQEILARPLMTPPVETDLTELVRVKLGYPEKAEEETTEGETSEATTEQAVESDDSANQSVEESE